MTPLTPIGPWPVISYLFFAKASTAQRGKGRQAQHPRNTKTGRRRKRGEQTHTHARARPSTPSTCDRVDSFRKLLNLG